MIHITKRFCIFKTGCYSYQDTWCYMQPLLSALKHLSVIVSLTVLHHWQWTMCHHSIASFDLQLKPIDRFMHEWVPDFRHPNTEKFQKILFSFFSIGMDWRLKDRKEHSSHFATRPFLTARTTEPQIQLLQEPRTQNSCQKERSNTITWYFNTSTTHHYATKWSWSWELEHRYLKFQFSPRCTHPAILTECRHNWNISVFQNWKIILSII